MIVDHARHDEAQHDEYEVPGVAGDNVFRQPILSRYS